MLNPLGDFMLTMSGCGMGGKGLGTGGAKHHYKILYDNIQGECMCNNVYCCCNSNTGIMKPAICCIACHGGVRHISGLIDEETHGVLMISLENVSCSV